MSATELDQACEAPFGSSEEGRQELKQSCCAIQPDKRRLSLGVKQLQPDVWDSFFAQHRVGDIIHGKVLRVANFGAFVEIADGVEGLCHNSEAVDDKGQQVHLEPGTEFDFKIIKMNPDEKKVGLSIKAVGEEASRQEVESYKHPASSTSSTIGELISEAGGRGTTSFSFSNHAKAAGPGSLLFVPCFFLRAAS
jgi:small subunit ribosomal protein S1